LPDGEVSPYLTQTLQVGYPLELRGPIGGWFVWDPAGPARRPRPCCSWRAGAAWWPLMGDDPRARRRGQHAPFRLIYSVRDPLPLLYGR
jgi:ferredoxin-NADP reductase